MKNNENSFDIKIKYFEYFIYKLLKFYNSYKNNDKYNIVSKKLNRNKAISLLYYLCSASISNDKSENNLFDIFNEWYVNIGNAFIEKDIYQLIRDDKFKFSFFTINRFDVLLDDGIELEKLKIDSISDIDNSFKMMLNKNPDLPIKSLNYLMDVMTDHDSYIEGCRRSNGSNNSFPVKVDMDIILNEIKYYQP